MSYKEQKEYEVLNPIGHAGRRERGETVMLTEEEASNYGSDYVRLVGSEPNKKATKAEKPLDKMTLKELQAKAEELELEKTGSKADLVERITLHLQENVE